MPAPTTSLEFLDLIKKSGIVSDARYADVSAATLPPDVNQAAHSLIQRGFITKFQAKQILAGRHKGFRIGSYIIKELLGHGGMGIVYLAEHQTLQRQVALKVLSNQVEGAEQTALVRFLREARAVAALDHPNIVRIHDVGQSNGVHFLVMEYVEGRTLDTLMTSGGALASGKAVEYIAQAAAGLAHAHERGFVHRDIKPANLILTNTGLVKILDMGLARSFDDPKDKLTAQLDAGAVLGTADFIAPEQALNEPHVDARADIYSLGATFYALVRGHAPFQGSTTQKLMQHQLREAPDLATLDKTFPQDLSDVICKMMAKSPGHRYQSMVDVLEALAPWVPEGPASMSGPLAAVSRRLPAVDLPKSSLHKAVPKWAVAAIVVAGVSIAALAVKWSWNKQPDEKNKELIAAAAPGITKTNPNPTNTNKGTSGAPKASVQKSNNSGKSNNAVVKSTPIQTKQVYKLDLSNQSVSMSRYEGYLKDGRNAARLISKTAEGEMPLGWVCHMIRPGAVAEFLASDDPGTWAIGMRTISGGAGAMLFMPTIKFPAGTQSATIQFECQGSKDNYSTLVKFKPKDKNAYNLKTISAGTKWSSHLIPVTLEGTTEGTFEFLQTESEADSTFWIKSIVVKVEVASSANTAIELFHFDASSVGDFRFKRKDRMIVEGSSPSLPPGLSLYTWKPETEGEFWKGKLDNTDYIGMLQYTETQSTQFTVELEKSAGVTLVSGRRYSVSVTYRTQGNGQGSLYTQYADYSVTSAKTSLSNSNNSWQTVDATFTRGDNPLRLLIDCNGVGEGNGLLVSKIRITELD